MPQKRSDTVEALLTGAEQAFAERGFHGASIGYICQCAGRTTGAFYSNYDSKMRLFLDVHRRHKDRTADSVSELLAGVTPGQDLAGQLAPALADVIHHLFDEQWLLLSIEFRLLALRDQAAAAAQVEQDEQFRQRIGAMLEAVFDRTGHHPVLSGLELTSLLGAMARGINLDRGVYQVSGRSVPLQLDTVTKALTGLLVTGPGAEPGSVRPAS